MTEDELTAVVERELDKYLAGIRSSQVPHIADAARWQPHAEAIAAAAVAVYLAQGGPRVDQYGVDQTATLANQVAQSDLVAGVPNEINEKLGLALAAGGTVAIIALLTTATAPAWAGLLSVVSVNVFLWAAAFGALAAAVYAGMTHKTWNARNDDKTRPTHRAVNGTKIPIGSLFEVGGFLLRGPHDMLGPAKEVYNCRCKLRFSRG